MTAGRHIVALIDDDDVPPGVFEVVAILQVARNVVPDPLQADGIQTDQRNGEPAPELLLELGEQALEGDAEDALPGLAKCLERRIELVGHQVYDPAMTRMDGGVIRPGPRSRLPAR